MIQKYNGWTNYETWRVNLEIFDGFEPGLYYSAFDPANAYELGQSLKEYATELIDQSGDGLARDYALAFLDAVNWREIANHMIDNYLEDVLTKNQEVA